jgi:hypothetical protein
MSLIPRREIFGDCQFRAPANQWPRAFRWRYILVCLWESNSAQTEDLSRSIRCRLCRLSVGAYEPFSVQGSHSLSEVNDHRSQFKKWSDYICHITCPSQKIALSIFSWIPGPGMISNYTAGRHGHTSWINANQCITRRHNRYHHSDNIATFQANRSVEEKTVEQSANLEMK